MTPAFFMLLHHSWRIWVNCMRFWRLMIRALSDGALAWKPVEFRKEQEKLALE